MYWLDALENAMKHSCSTIGQINQSLVTSLALCVGMFGYTFEAYQFNRPLTNTFMGYYGSNIKVSSQRQGVVTIPDANMYGPSK